MSRMNRLANVHSRFQGQYKRVLCVCSAGLLRSPTAAVVLSQPPFEFNTRAAGCVPEYALVPVDDALLAWADEVVCMEFNHARILAENFNIDDKIIIVLDIPNNYEYRDAELMTLIRERYAAHKTRSNET